MSETNAGRWLDEIGVALGWLWAPLTGAISRARHARMFHPEGVVYSAEVSALVDTEFGTLARRLSGPGLVRLSSAWWRGGRELPDALGLALRLHRDPPSAVPAPGDQDLLFATIRHPWTLPFAPLTTHVHDFLANDYYGVAPFEIDGIGRAWLRAVSAGNSPSASDRAGRLRRAVETGEAVFLLELRRPGARWQPLATVRLVAPAPIDQERLRFSPFRDGRGISPSGFVHGLRRGTYFTSQLARPAHR